MTLLAATRADLADKLRPVLLRLSRQLRREAQRIGASAVDVQLLAIVKNTPAIGLSGLAEKEGISKPAMSAHMKRLEETGWVVRDEDGHDDKRRVGFSITKAGLKALDDVRRQRNDWLAARLATLSDEEAAAVIAAITPLQKLGETP